MSELHATSCAACGNLNEGTRTHCFRCGQTLSAPGSGPSQPASGTESVGWPESGVEETGDLVAIGDLLDSRYRILQRLGEGAMGQVYEASDERLGRRVALKVLLPSLLERPNARARVEREARAMARLRHPNVVEIHNSFEHKGGLVLDLELVEGGSLADHLHIPGENTGAKLPLEQAVRTACGVLEGLSALHSVGLVHRDLKPGNVLMTPDGLPKVTDLGIAHDGEGRALTRVGARLGTPEYMAPEQILGKSIDARTDLYALGIMLYEMLSGDLPFTGSTDFELHQQHVTKEANFGPLKGVATPDVLSILERALEKAPDSRFASALEFNQALHDAFPGGLGLPAPLPPRVSQTGGTASNPAVGSGHDDAGTGGDAQATHPTTGPGVQTPITGAGSVVPTPPPPRIVRATPKNPTQEWLIAGAGVMLLIGLIVFAAGSGGKDGDQAAPAIGSCVDGESCTRACKSAVDPVTRANACTMSCDEFYVSEACTKLADLIKDGKVPGRSPYEAESIYEKTCRAANGDPAACFGLGLLHMKKGYPGGGEAWFRRGCNKGHSLSCDSL